MKRSTTYFMYVSLLLVAAVVATATNSLPSLDMIHNGMHPQRGGNIFIETTVERKQSESSYDGAIFFHDSSKTIFVKPESKRFGGVRKLMDAMQVADVIAQSLAVPVANADFKSPSFLKASLIDAASTNAFVGIQGFGALAVNKFKLKELGAVVENAADFARLEYNAQPQDPVAIMQTLGSGAYPSRHGIVGSRWIESVQNTNPDITEFAYDSVLAYSSQSSNSLVPSIGDRIAAAFGQEAKVVCTSGLGIMGAYAFAKNGEISEVDEASVFDVLNNEQGIRELSSDNISVALLKSKRSVVVQRLRMPVHLRPDEFADSAPVTFDLSDSNVAAFFAELIHFNEIVKNSADVSSKTAPEFFSFVYTGFPRLVSSVKGNFKKIEAAAAVIDAHVGKLLRTLEEQSSGRFVAEVAFLGSPSDYIPSREIAKPILPALLAAYPDAASQLADYFPSVYVPPSQVAGVCADLSSRLSSFKDIRVVCALDSIEASNVETSFLQLSSELKSSESTTVSLSAQPEGEDVNRYQIVLWTFVILFFVLFYIISGTINMEYKKDQSLWGTVPAGARP